MKLIDLDQTMKKAWPIIFLDHFPNYALDMQDSPGIRKIPDLSVRLTDGEEWLSHQRRLMPASLTSLWWLALLIMILDISPLQIVIVLTLFPEANVATEDRWCLCATALI